MVFKKLELDLWSSGHQDTESSETLSRNEQTSLTGIAVTCVGVHMRVCVCVRAEKVSSTSRLLSSVCLFGFKITESNPLLLPFSSLRLAKNKVLVTGLVRVKDSCSMDNNY